MPKDTPFSEIQKRCEEELGVPVASQRFWTWAKRQNNTFRPNRPLTAEELALPVCQIKPDPPPKSDHEPLKLLLEAPFPAQPKGRPAPLPEILRDPAPNPDILLFFKFYDPSAKDAAGGAGALRFVGWRFEKSKAQVDALRDFCCGAAGLPRGTELLFFEEIKSEEKVMCEPMEPRTTLKACQLEDGDIVCFQRAAIPAGARFPKVPEYLVCEKPPPPPLRLPNRPPSQPARASSSPYRPRFASPRIPSSADVHQGPHDHHLQGARQAQGGWVRPRALQGASEWLSFMMRGWRPVVPRGGLQLRLWAWGAPEMSAECDARLCPARDRATRTTR